MFESRLVLAVTCVFLATTVSAVKVAITVELNDGTRVREPLSKAHFNTRGIFRPALSTTMHILSIDSRHSFQLQLRPSTAFIAKKVPVIVGAGPRVLPRHLTWHNPQPCYYYGVVVGDPSSFVAVQLCKHALKARGCWRGRDFTIAPTNASAGAMKRQLLTQSHELRFLHDSHQSKVQHSAPDLWKLIQRTSSRQHSSHPPVHTLSATQQPTYNIELFVVAERGVLNQYGLTRGGCDPALTDLETAVSVVSDQIIDIMHVADSLLRSSGLNLGIRLKAIELWTANPIAIGAGGLDSLAVFETWARPFADDIVNHRAHDAAVLIHAISGPRGVANVQQAYCGDDFYSIVNFQVGGNCPESIETTGYTAETVAHELMHGLGAKHSNDEGCPGEFIMRSTSIGFSKWSDCTLNTVRPLLPLPGNACLLTDKVDYQKECSAGFYSSDTTNSSARCHPCWEGCTMCSSGAVDSCQRCNNSFVLHQGRCLESCPSGFQEKPLDLAAALTIQGRTCQSGTGETYTEQVGTWSVCTKPCGGGTQTRTLTCTRDSDGQTVALSFCESATITQRTCSTFDCPSWTLGDWTPCNMTCNGTRARSVTCVNYLATSVADSECTDPKPPMFEMCGTTCTAVVNSTCVNTSLVFTNGTRLFDHPSCRHNTTSYCVNRTLVFGNGTQLVNHTSCVDTTAVAGNVTCMNSTLMFPNGTELLNHPLCMTSVAFCRNGSLLFHNGTSIANHVLCNASALSNSTFPTNSSGAVDVITIGNHTNTSQPLPGPGGATSGPKIGALGVAEFSGVVVGCALLVLAAVVVRRMMKKIEADNKPKENRGALDDTHTSIDIDFPPSPDSTLRRTSPWHRSSSTDDGASNPCFASGELDLGFDLSPNGSTGRNTPIPRAGTCDDDDDLFSLGPITFRDEDQGDLPTYRNPTAHSLIRALKTPRTKTAPSSDKTRKKKPKRKASVKRTPTEARTGNTAKQLSQSPARRKLLGTVSKSSRKKSKHKRVSSLPFVYTSSNPVSPAHAAPQPSAQTTMHPQAKLRKHKRSRSSVPASFSSSPTSPINPPGHTVVATGKKTNRRKVRPLRRSSTGLPVRTTKPRRVRSKVRRTSTSRTTSKKKVPLRRSTSMTAARAKVEEALQRGIAANMKPGRPPIAPSSTLKKKSAVKPRLKRSVTSSERL